jgi:hypothetical protein
LESEPEIIPERGQTYQEFASLKRNMVTKYNNVIYLLPLESFPAQYLANLRNYIKAFYFPMKVKILKLKEVERMDIETTVNEDKGKLQYHGKQIISKLE